MVEFMFDGVRRAYDLQILYVMKVIEQLGTDKALELLEEASKRQGVIIAREMRRKLPKDLSSLQIGAEVYRRFLEDAGAEIKIHKQDEHSVTFLINRCPFFEAFLDVGVDCGMFLNGLCTHLTLPSIQATLNEFDQKLRVEPVLTRESAEEFCLERVYITE
ncbi:L-2-amino-thiazoline-4-carboxylic acid hydrolase [Candidatus Bathyarchaeota archaeon]|nr:L-2-amino-thiazoline-4-carboxylic acid hydrolase [Candidatus Bathyarchaeota archaeon]